jgi:hypothetical protein
MKIYIDKGWLIQMVEVSVDGSVYTDKKGEPYMALLRFQVYDESGAPATLSYSGVGLVDGARIVIGDPHRDTKLLEAKVDRQASSESWDQYLGFKEAITEKRSPTAKQYQSRVALASRMWADGYQQGFAMRKTNGVRKS